MPRSLAFALLALAATNAYAQDFDGAGEQSMLDRINSIRQEHHLAPVSRDAQLDAAARLHSQDMAAHGQLTHVSEATGTPADRVRRAGVTATTVTENVALHRSVDEAYQALLASDPHRANMLNPDVTRVGLAALRSERGVWVTQLFAQVAQAPQVVEAVPVGPVGRSVVQQVRPQPVQQNPAQVQAPPVQTGRPAPASVEPDPGSDGSVLLERDARGQIQAYWVFGSGRWWYYPMPTGAQPGQQLICDTSVEGPPPGYNGPLVGAPSQPPPQVAQPQIAQPPPQQQQQGQTIAIDPFTGTQIQLPGGQYYDVPPPPFVGAPTRAWQRAQDRWQRAYEQWMRQQEELRRRAL